MLFSNLTQKIHKFFQPRLPGVACEMTQQFFSVVRLNAKYPPEVDRFAVAPVPQGLVTPSLTLPNIASPSDFLNVMRLALAKADIKTNKISLAIPDASAKLAIHHFDALPGNENEKLQLLKWKLKKTIPFNIEDSQLSYLEQKTPEGKYVVVTVNIHKEVLSQFEHLFDSLGIHVGYITLASFAAFELLARLDAEVLQKSVLFLRVRPPHISSLIVRQGAVVFFRHVDYGAGEPPTAGESPSEAIDSRFVDLYDEIHPCLMYYQDKLGASGVEKIYLTQPFASDPGLLSSLSERSKSTVLNLDPLRLFHWRDSAASHPMANALVPSLGLALGKF